MRPSARRVDAYLTPFGDSRSIAANIFRTDASVSLVLSGLIFAVTMRTDKYFPFVSV